MSLRLFASAGLKGRCQRLRGCGGALVSCSTNMLTGLDLPTSIAWGPVREARILILGYGNEKPEIGPTRRGLGKLRGLPARLRIRSSSQISGFHCGRLSGRPWEHLSFR